MRPGLTRLVAAPLLLSGGLLLAGATALLRTDGGPVLSWVLAVELVVHAAVVWWTPVRTVVGDLAVSTGAVAAVLAIVGGTLLIGPGQHGWGSLLGIPVLYGASQFRRVVGVAVTLLSCAGGVCVLVLTRQDTPLDVVVVDVVLVCSSLALLGGFVVHVTEHLDRLVAELERVAAVDGLTGLVTRRVLDDALAASLTTARSATGTALVLVDLDHFKSVNDRHGHPVGDAVLQHVCPVAVAADRAGDLVRAVREAPLPLADGSLLHLTVSVGVAHAPDHAVDVRSLYTVADTALYAAKRAGRDGFAVAGEPG